MFLVLLISRKNYSLIYQVESYLFAINYMPIKYKFPGNVKYQQFVTKTTISATSFDVN